MSNIKKKVISSAMLSATLLGTVSPMLNVVHADEPETLSIYKTSYEHGDSPTVDNNGDEVSSLDSKLKYWNPEETGDVGFLARTITKGEIEANETLKEAVGTIKKNKLNNHYTLTNAQVKAIKDYMVANPYSTKKPSSLFSKQNLTNIKYVDSTGKADFNIDLDGSSDNDIVAIIAEEAVAPKAFTAVKAEPIVIPVPVTSNDGTGYKNHLAVYPKNEIKRPSIQFMNSGDILPLPPVEGAKFALYKGEAGSGELVKDNLSLTTQGLTIENMTKGKYYLVEEESTNVAKDGSKKYLTSYYAQNDTNNKLTFEVTDDVTDVQLSKALVSTSTPKAQKIFSYDQTYFANMKVSYKGTVDVPGAFKTTRVTNGSSLEEYTQFSQFDYVDTANKALSYNLDSVQVSVKNKATGQVLTTLTKDTDYTVSLDSDKNQMRVALTQDGINKIGNYNQDRVMDVDYTMNLTKNAKPNTQYENKYHIEYNNTPDTNAKNVIKTADKQIDFEIYGVKFKKTDDGIFGTDFANQGIKGAEFLLKAKEVAGNQTDTIPANAYVVGFSDDGHGYKYMTTEQAPENNTSTSDVTYGATFAQIKETAKANGFVYTSGDDGNFEVTGLAIGKYALTEIKAPTGYQKLDNDFDFEITKTSYNGDSLAIENTRKPNMPLTGSEKLVILAGAGLLVVGAYAVISSKKKKEA